MMVVPAPDTPSWKNSQPFPSGLKLFFRFTIASPGMSCMIVPIGYLRFGLPLSRTRFAFLRAWASC